MFVRARGTRVKNARDISLDVDNLSCDVVTPRCRDVTTSPARYTHVVIVRIRSSPLSLGGTLFRTATMRRKNSARELPTPPVNRFITGRLDFADTYVECARFDRARLTSRHRRDFVRDFVPTPGRRGISRNS